MVETGLINITRAGHTWITTRGYNCGVAKQVGRIFAKLNDAVSIVGILAWGDVCNQDDLHDCLDSDSVISLDRWAQQFAPREYNFMPDNPASLDVNHTHFILIDDENVPKKRITPSRRVSLRDHLPGAEHLFRQKFEAAVTARGNFSDFGLMDNNLGGRPCVPCVG